MMSATVSSSSNNFHVALQFPGGHARGVKLGSCTRHCACYHSITGITRPPMLWQCACVLPACTRGLFWDSFITDTQLVLIPHAYLIFDGIKNRNPGSGG